MIPARFLSGKPRSLLVTEEDLLMLCEAYGPLDTAAQILHLTQCEVTLRLLDVNRYLTEMGVSTESHRAFLAAEPIVLVNLLP